MTRAKAWDYGYFGEIQIGQDDREGASSGCGVPKYVEKVCTLGIVAGCHARFLRSRWGGLLCSCRRILVGSVIHLGWGTGGTGLGLWAW